MMLGSTSVALATNFLFVEVPDDAKNFKFNEDSFSCIIMFETNNNIDSIEVSKEKQQLIVISTTKDITEEQAESIVEKHPNIFYRDYMCNSFDRYMDGWTKNWLANTAKESLQSLINANGLDLNKNYLILKEDK